jgi:hypothetical protein
MFILRAVVLPNVRRKALRQAALPKIKEPKMSQHIQVTDRWNCPFYDDSNGVCLALQVKPGTNSRKCICDDPEGVSLGNCPLREGSVMVEFFTGS